MAVAVDELAVLESHRARALEHLQVLTADVPERCHVELWQAGDRQAYYYRLDRLELAATHVDVYGDQLYICISGAGDERDRHSRISAGDADYTFGLVADGDVKPGAFTSKQDARTFFDSLAVRPSCVVDSGGGLQAFWRYSTVPRLDDESRTEYVDLARLWGAYVHTAAEQIGVHLDSTHDLARLMRIPGGINTKYSAPRLVRLDSVSDRRYSPDTLRAKVPAKVMTKLCAHAELLSATPSPTMPNEQVLTLVRRGGNADKFERLWGGNWDGTYASKSDAVMALIGILKFYSQDPLQLEQLILESGLADEKRKRTLARHDIPRALANVTETYSGGNGVIRHGDARPAVDEDLEEATSLANVEARDIDWLWPSRLAYGKLSIFEGDPDVGKGLGSIDIASRFSAAADMPDGTPCVGGAVLLITSEDSLEDTIKPRLECCPITPRMEQIFHRTTCVVKGRRRKLNIIDDIDVIRRDVEQHHIGLVIVDPLAEHLPPGTSPNDEVKIRAALSPLVDLAQELGFALLVIRHLNKKTDLPALYRGGGAIGIIGRARAAYAFTRLPDAPADTYVMVKLKCNIGKAPPPLVYTIELPAARQRTVHVEWHPTRTVSQSADELLAYRTPQDAGAVGQAIAFLEETLADGPRFNRDVKADAEAQGISIRTLQRAQAVLKLAVKRRSEFDASTMWALNDGTAP